MRIGISGYFGYQNLGDEIFLEVWKRLFAGHEVFSLCGYEDLNTVDRIIIGGGDLIIPHLFTNAYWKPEFLQVPVWVYGVGVPTRLKALPKECSKYCAFLDKCQKVYVRDENSKDWLLEKGVYVGAEVVNDIAWNYPLLTVKYKGFYSKTLGVSIRHQSIFNQKNIIKLLVEQAEKYNILMIPLQPGYDKNWNDISLHQELKKEIKKRVPGAHINIVPPYADIDQRIKFIASVDIYITERMHGMLMSLKSKTPVMPIAVGNKFYAVMKRFGLENYIVDSHSLVEMKEKLQSLQQFSKDKKIDTIYSKVKDIVKQTGTELEKFKKGLLAT